MTDQLYYMNYQLYVVFIDLAAKIIIIIALNAECKNDLKISAAVVLLSETQDL